MKHDINLIVCPPRKLKDLIGTKKDPIMGHEIAHIYTIPFRTNNNYGMECIGMTNGKLNERIKEYKADVKFCH